ncbi:flavohemoglobin expression-modulating QEGLA motif protein [Gilvimarinus sp. SDUM040013]|uniref:Flavohemoglobin expression-modulating QEGLA motif protein n=1 Tax=Gilvimarinus gilvus TaxID=3058038 RepID=A0ABU4S124_9GAMM|nr:flavohemoglobin expression-modulating QEGLA motif protein [Gilvimarinus sp. SDUM040013]MDO3384793.1 flavohemoglobin expression-modulating QEGLA motif protein [Gilvimarinus sp. SDUM040013]MDX6850874.1 flavohemoglobin expression-modulating QEGLA motif protein [Gilvimarinus sp. SDUM040013]
MNIDIEPMPATWRSLDAALFDVVKGTDILDAIAPVNYKEQKLRFFNSGFSVNPEFAYRSVSIDTFQKRRALYALPIENIDDTDLAELYIDVVGSYADKLGQLNAIGTPDFLYESLRYYGEPTEKDIRNAEFLLHLPERLTAEPEQQHESPVLVEALRQFALQEGYDFQLVLDDSMIAKALVSGTQVKINASVRVTQTEISALAHHELGVHLVTTLNARDQRLRVLQLGSPVNTTAQEGLAILCEYLSGSLTVDRLKVLALRVVAVQSLVKERSFKSTFALLKEQYGVPDELAFTITARVYRGGGFTKDCLYLKGFHQVINAFETRKDFNNLMCGKLSIEHLDKITRLIGKGVLQQPKYISPAVARPVAVDDVQQFIVHAIR